MTFIILDWNSGTMELEFWNWNWTGTGLELEFNSLCIIFPVFLTKLFIFKN